MIIGEHKEIEKENVAGDFNSIEAGIDEGSMTFLFEMLSKSLYSNPIGSIVREYTSNCFDSHTEAGVDKAVVINYKTDDEGDFISFQDFGVGLSTERIQTVFMKYFSSTKRDSNEQIGGFGLGSKSALAYSDYFYINTNFNGIAYQYIFSKGEKKPTLDLLDEAETTEENGTEIKIYIKNSNDRNKFRNELLSQLCYFDNVYFNNWGIDNDYKIYETETFKYRNQDQYNDEMHIILGKVSYPISWNEINLKQVKIPIGVKFEIGELQVTPNRESLRYTDEAKVLIREKVNAAVEELKALYKDDTMLYDNWHEYLQNKDARPYILLGDSDKLYLTGLKESKAVFKPFYDLGIDSDNYRLSSLMNGMYESAGRIETVEKVNSNGYNSSVYSRFDNHNRVLLSKNRQFINIRNLKFIHNDVFVKRKLDRYFVTQIGEFIIGKNVADPMTGEVKFHKYFNLGIAMKAYKVYKIIEAMVTPLIVDYNCELTEEDNEKYKNYQAEKNKVNIERKNLGKFPCKDITLESYGYEYQYDMQIGELNNFKGVVIYGFIEDEKQLRTVSTALHYFKDLQCYKKFYKNGKTFYKFNDKVERPVGRYRRYMSDQECLNPKAIKVVRIAKNNEKHFKKSNMIHVKEFSSDNRMFRKLATIFKIEKMIKELMYNQSGYRDDSLVDYFLAINKDLGANLHHLIKYKDEHTFCHPNREDMDSFNKFKTEVLVLAEKNNWFDTTITDKLDYVINWFKDVEIIKFVDFNEKSLPLILKYLYDNKKKINIEYYVKYVRPELLEGQLVIDFEPKEEETETKLFQILQQVA